ncbi:MAG: TetR/AcrR family transcriptional regulator, partial [Bradymonadia bacterium]
KIIIPNCSQSTTLAKCSQTTTLNQVKNERHLMSRQSTPAPKGKSEVQKALIQAAGECFADRGIAQVSIREIATRAGVNHGLVHRHFGSKDGLLKATLRALSSSVDERLSHVDPNEPLFSLLPKIFGGTKDVGLHWRVVTHALLEGMSVTDLQDNFPVFQRIVKAAKVSGKAHDEALGQSALIFATGLGYMVFEPYLRGAVAHDGSDWEEIRPQLMQQFLRLAT